MDRNRKMKQHFIDKIETKLSKQEIIERVRGITQEEKFFHIFPADDDHFCRGKFDEDTFSLFYLGLGKGDILLPRIHGEIAESEGGSSVIVSYSETWGHIFVAKTHMNNINKKSVEILKQTL